MPDPAESSAAPAGPPATPPPPSPPPRAFSQGVGTLFQTVGATLFLAFTFFCCGSALTSKEWATRPDRERVGWRSASGRVVYSERDWAIATVSGGVLAGLGLAGVGLGLQADKRRAGVAGVPLTAVATLFWIVQAAFAAHALGSLFFTAICSLLAVLSGILVAFAVGALRELVRNPPAAGYDVLPAEFQTPFSHLHQDSPEARLAGEIAQRRRRLEVEQKELESLERRLRRRLEEK